MRTKFTKKIDDHAYNIKEKISIKISEFTTKTHPKPTHSEKILRKFAPIKPPKTNSLPAESTYVTCWRLEVWIRSKNSVNYFNNAYLQRKWQICTARRMHTQAWTWQAKLIQPENESRPDGPSDERLSPERPYKNASRAATYDVQPK